jgi:hypothetical protein
MTLVASLTSCSGAAPEDSAPTALVSFDSAGEPVLPVNAKGQTYGSSYGLTPDQEPDLVSVTATNGKIGYALRTDLYLADPASPEEAVARQRDRTMSELNACLEAIGVEATPVTLDDVETAEVAEALQALKDGATGPAVSSNGEESFRELLALVNAGWPVGDRDVAESARSCADAAAGATRRTVPVYESDGETVIGEFQLG